MKYKIVPRPIDMEIEAEDINNAMVKFAWKMESDMNLYFKAIPIEEKEN